MIFYNNKYKKLNNNKIIHKNLKNNNQNKV